DHADMRSPRRYEAAHLCEHRDQCVLAQKGRFARHVRPGDQPDAAGPLATLLRGARWWRRQIAIVGDKRTAIGRERLLDNRMTPAGDGESEAAIDLRTHVIALDRE